MDPATIALIIAAAQAVLGTIAGAIESSIKVTQEAITQRRQIIGNEIIAFINSGTTNYKDVIFAVLAIICILGLAYITNRKKQ